MARCLLRVSWIIKKGHGRRMSQGVDLKVGQYNERSSIFRDLGGMSVGTVFLILATLGFGAYLREEMFGSDESNVDASEYAWVADDGVGNWSKRQDENAENVQKLVGGENRSDLDEILGSPDHVIRYGADVEILFFRTSHEHSDGVTTPDETTPVVMVDDEVVSWGQPAGGFRQYRRRTSAGDDWETRQDSNRVTIAELTGTESKAEILDRLGPPDFSDPITDDVEVFSYRTHSLSLNGYTDRSETTRLVFRNGALIAIDS